MTSPGIALLIGMLGLINSNLNARGTNGPGSQKFVFSRIIYHSTHCNGTCPQIDLEIDSSGNVLLKREFWKAKGEVEDHGSGSFKGKIDPKTYFDLIATLIKSDYSKLKFPPEFCCDASVTTIIIYANGRRTRLSSMSPPADAYSLISFLHDLATKIKIPPTADKINLEN